MKPIKINSQEKEIEVKYKYRVKNTVTPKNVTVKFESNGGSNVEPQTIKYGELLTEPDKPMSRNRMEHYMQNGLI